MSGIKTWQQGEPVDYDDLNSNFEKILTTQNYTFGETITENDSLYFNSSDNKVYKADADNASHVANWLGFAVESGVADDVKGVQTTGKKGNFSSLTEGETYHIGNTPGAITVAQGTIAREVGMAVSETEILIFSRASTGLRTPVVQVFESSGIYTPTSGVRYVIVEVVGGGGGGRQAGSDSGASGGGGGGYSRKLIPVTDLGVTETVTVGAGGGNEANGGTSSFGSHCQATGGQTGSNDRKGGNGGAGSGGDINSNGNGGGSGGEGFSGSSSVGRFGGHGGGSVFGGGAEADQAQSTGTNATGYGGGGAGGCTGSSSGNAAGGSGYAGVVIVTEYFW